MNYLLEIDYTPYGASCREPYCSPLGELVLCRRQMRHTGKHATRRGAEAIVWGYDDGEEKEEEG